MLFSGFISYSTSAEQSFFTFFSGLVWKKREVFSRLFLLVWFLLVCFFAVYVKSLVFLLIWFGPCYSVRIVTLVTNTSTIVLFRSNNW